MTNPPVHLWRNKWTTLTPRDVRDRQRGGDPGKVDVRLPGEGNSDSHGARPVHLIISTMKWIRTSRLSIKISLLRRPAWCCGNACAVAMRLFYAFGYGIWRETHTCPSAAGLHRCLAHKKSLPPWDPTVGLCPGPFGGRRGWVFSYERGTPLALH